MKHKKHLRKQNEDSPGGGGGGSGGGGNNDGEHSINNDSRDSNLASVSAADPGDGEGVGSVPISDNGGDADAFKGRINFLKMAAAAAAVSDHSIEHQTRGNNNPAIT